MQINNYLNDKEILKRHKVKELLSLYRKTLTTISKIKITTLQVDVSATFRQGEFRFHITIFDRIGNNKSLDVYDFSDINRAKIAVRRVISVIKTDSFANVEAENFRV
jgi:hypothetical protein